MTRRSTEPLGCLDLVIGGVVVAIMALPVLFLLGWCNNRFADQCRQRGGTVVTGGRSGTMCIEAPR